MATYRTRKTGRTVLTLLLGAGLAVLVFVAVDWIGGWL